MTSTRAPAIEQVVSLLAVGSTEEDFLCLRNICALAGWNLHEARDLQQARAEMRQKMIAVVLCQYKLADGDWSELLDAACLPIPPPYVIVWSRHADERLWAEVINLGGFDLLWAPFEVPDVLEAVSTAIRKWREWEIALRSRRKGSAA